MFPVFHGTVTVTRGLQQIEANEASYDPTTGEFKVSGRAYYREPGFEVSADDARYDSTIGEIEFGNATFEIPGLPAKGEAASVLANGDGKMSMDEIIYTNLPGKKTRIGNSGQGILIWTCANPRGSHVRFLCISKTYRSPICLTFLSRWTRRASRVSFFRSLVARDNSGTELSVPYY